MKLFSYFFFSASNKISFKSKKFIFDIFFENKMIRYRGKLIEFLKFKIDFNEMNLKIVIKIKNC
jgi:hypothetical protein